MDVGDARALLQRAFDQGVTVYDLSDVYGNGRSEVIAGVAFRERRDRVVLVTKAGYLTGIDGAQQLFTQSPQCFEPGYLRTACELSLRRLQTDRIDVFLLHDPPRNVLESEELWCALEGLQRAGKIRHHGVSSSPEGALAAIQRGRAEVVEVPFSLLAPQAAQELFPLAEQKGVGVLARSPFAGGRLFQDAGKRFASLAAQGPQTLVQAALHYSLSQRAVASAVVGVMGAAELEENLAACQAPALAAGAPRWVENALPADAAWLPRRLKQLTPAPVRATVRRVLRRHHRSASRG
jgi:aryl-alcohol dehydrogenase-like predicted oxidoreductase